MISVVIPYMERLAQGQGNEKELKYAIRSFEKYCDFDFNIVLVGDCPSWYKGDFIPTQAIRGMQFARCFDIANKLNHICNSPIITDDFIYSYDDIYLINKCTIDDFKKIVALGIANRHSVSKDGSENYKRLFAQTIKDLDKDELYIYETHLPRILNKEKLSLIYRAYNLRQRPILFSTIYFNEFFDYPDEILMEKNTIKLGIYQQLPKSEIERQVKDYKFLNHTEKSYGIGMQNFLKEKYKNKSRFEK